LRALGVVSSLLVFCPNALAQNQCGDTLAWNNPLCQQIKTGSLGSQWTVVSRHGEYAQSETECNIPSAVSQLPGSVTITATAAAYTCGNFNADATVDTTPASWPYSTGDIQFNTFNFSPHGSGGSADCQGTCTITVVGRMPSSNTSLWPAFWLLGSNCQDSNKWSGDTGFDGCPDLGQAGYTEIDMTECYGGGWCQFHVANPGFGIGSGCDAVYAVDTNQHEFKTVWTSTSVKQYIDGALATTCNESMTNPMFFIAQIQTGGAGGTPVDSNLPASLVLNSVTITDANSNVLFSDNFQGAGQPPPDAGSPDAGGGGGGGDGGASADAGPVLTPSATGCACTVGEHGPSALFAALVLAKLRPGRRLRAPRPG
jgi:MYXO-CTERM domain-containing protein